MTRTFEIELAGTALVKGRPRFDSRRRRAYTPANTAAWEDRIRAAFLAAHGRPLLAGPVRATLRFRQERGDLDNLSKACLDALNGIAYNDDAQVSELHVYRDERRGKAKARTLIRIEECGPGSLPDFVGYEPPPPAAAPASSRRSNSRR